LRKRPLATTDKIHAAGLKAGMHTLTGCISPNDPWVTPVPDKRLAADATFALAAALDEKQSTVPTLEKPEDLDTMWAYASRGNVLRIDDELIQYTGLSQTPPHGLTGCQRGELGTKAAPHAQGSPVRHLFVRYGCFLPDEDSTLVDELAGRIARVLNTCGFDMIYMDGAEGMVGGWHGVAKMCEAIFRKFQRRVLVEASEWGYQPAAILAHLRRAICEGRFRRVAVLRATATGAGRGAIRQLHLALRRHPCGGNREGMCHSRDRYAPTRAEPLLKAPCLAPVRYFP
jgi:hypothetical protein